MWVLEERHDIRWLDDSPGFIYIIYLQSNKCRILIDLRCRESGKFHFFFSTLHWRSSLSQFIKMLSSIENSMVEEWVMGLFTCLNQPVIIGAHHSLMDRHMTLITNLTIPHIRIASLQSLKLHNSYNCLSDKLQERVAILN